MDYELWTSFQSANEDLIVHLMPHNVATDRASGS